MKFLEDEQKAFCNCCQNDTKHELLFEASNSDKPSEMKPFSFRKHQLIGCLGCDSISYRLIVGGKGLGDGFVFLHPPRIARELRVGVPLPTSSKVEVSLYTLAKF